MTLESRVNVARYIGNGVANAFPFAFKAWKKNQVLVFLGDGAQEENVTAQCTITLTASGGTVTFNSAPERNSIIVIRRNMPYVQEDDYRNGSRFDGEEIEDRFDQDCAERQDLRIDVDRAIKAPLTSEKTSEEYSDEFWTAYGDAQSIRDDVASMQASVEGTLSAIDAAKGEALDAVEAEGDRQIQRVENAMPAVMADNGSACMEMNWVLSADVAANSEIDISPLWYVVGRHNLQVSVNGVKMYPARQYAEKGDDNSKAHVFTTLVKLCAGDCVNVWCCHLSGRDVSAIATNDYDGLMGTADRVKLDGVESGAQANVIETVKVNGSALAVSDKAVDIRIPTFSSAKTVLESAISAGTAITVPSHAVGSGMLHVFHNGVFCEEGSGAQYVDASSTTITFNYDLAQGDVLSFAAVSTNAV